MWQPAWGIRLILEALIAFLPSPADGAIGSLDWTSEERIRECRSNDNVYEFASGLDCIVCAVVFSNNVSFAHHSIVDAFHPIGLAKKSVEFNCHRCGKVVDLLPKTKKERPVGASRFQKEIEQLRLAQIANEGQNTASKSSAENAEKTDEAKPTTDVGTAPKDDAPNENEPSGSDDTATEQETQTPVAPELVAEDTDTKHPAVETTTERSGVPQPTPVETTTPEQVLPAEATEGLEIPVWFTDPILNIMIILIAIIMFLLIHKARVMLGEIAELNDEYFKLEQQLIQQQQQQQS